MKLVIFGASGRTGRALVEQALEAGHDVTAAVRNPANFPIQHERLQVVKADILDPASVEAAVQGKNAVLSTVGPRKRTLFGAYKPEGLYSQGIKNILQAMQKNGIRRLVCVTAAAADDNYTPPGLYGSVIIPLFMRKLLADMKLMQREISKTNLDWIVVRPARLSDYPRTDEYRISLRPTPKDLATRRTDLAAFMLKELTDTQYLRKLPVIAD
ncbi:NAD(P)-dependent oxidoreductase [Dictyobacter kobayashii]|uniref:NAD-dependent epimerase n=1 Tax=Dictyobacter kobayashii TaxID=2014872 RepID=A0A402AW81_9CHLR|nr:SDR family oxidoreductase [Dictyobacter kobayashii]GCE23356.1 NAD-dependent epimerase [Dictyobacter kobayashii]